MFILQASGGAMDQAGEEEGAGLDHHRGSEARRGRLAGLHS